MEQFKPFFLADLLGLKELFSAKCSDRLVGLNPSKTGIPITQISEARDEHPLERRLLSVINLRVRACTLECIVLARRRDRVSCPQIPAIALPLAFTSSVRFAFCLLPTAFCLFGHFFEPSSSH